MNVFEAVKAAITVRKAAEHYGLEVNRNGMTYCPFHEDRHPSLKVNEEYFFCFGCGATGDVIDFVARLFNLNLLKGWKARYAPRTPDDKLDDRFVEACQMFERIEYLLDILTVGCLEERVSVVEELMKDRKIALLENYTAQKRKEAKHRVKEPEIA